MHVKIEDVHKFYGEQESRTEVLKGVSCEIQDGEICVLLGPSGSGKSTLLNILGGLEQADEGTIQIEDLPIESLSSKELARYRRDQLGFVFQFYNLIPDLSVKENIEVGSYLSPHPLPLPQLLQILGLQGHAGKLPSQLSGGQQQRTAIGRALVKNPSLLLCDEPTGALDYQTSRDILELIETINEKYRNTILIVTHNQAIAQMAHRVLRLHDGKIVSNTLNTSRTPARQLEW